MKLDLTIPKPKKVSIAINLLWLSIIISIIHRVILLIGIQYNSDIITFVFNAIVDVFVVVLSIFLVYQINIRKDWARNAFLILLILKTISVCFALCDKSYNQTDKVFLLIGFITQLIAVIILYNKESNKWFSNKEIFTEPEIEPTNDEILFKERVLKVVEDSNLIQKQKPPYLLGLLCLIPLVGLFVGIGLLLNGLIKYKDKWLSLIGVFGIMFTIVVYSILFYAGTHAKVFKQGFADISQMQLNSLVKNIEFYKLQHGQYPDSLQQLLNDDKLAPINDAIQLNQQRSNSFYNYKKIGEKYLLFSSGEDGIPNTQDDFYPQITISDSNKIGLIRSK